MVFKPHAKQIELNRAIASHKYTLAIGGSRSGKTADFCYATILRAFHKPSRHAILRFHFHDVKQSIGMDTMPKILKLMGIPYTINKTDWYFSINCKDGGRSEIWISGLDDKDRVDNVLGKEYSTIYINEASQVSYHAYTTALTRLAENSGLNNKIFIDCNPPEKSHWLYQMFVLNKQPETEMDLSNPGMYCMVRMNPVDNPYLPKDYISDVLETLPDRKRKRFLYGEWLDKLEGALFNQDDIERSRVSAPPQYLPRAIVAIDPSISSTDNSDETGIVVVAQDSLGEYYVLRDCSMIGTPSEWSGAVAAVYSELKLDSAVYEFNQGGEMVEHTIHTSNQNIICHAVRATRGKALRAEPVAALYEQGKVHHVGYFPELEEQMTEWTPNDKNSPDRLDALVWGIVYLMSLPVRLGIQPNNPVSSTGIKGWNDSSIGRPPSFGGKWF